MAFTPRLPHPASAIDTGEFCVLGGESLDTWLRRSWDDGVQTQDVEDLSVLRVHTRNSTYDLVVVSGGVGQMLVRGGRYFPGWTPVCFLGCSLGGGLLKRHSVHVGLRLEFYWGDRRIVTSPVAAIDRHEAARPAVAC